MDFDRQGKHVSLLLEFMTENGFVASVGLTYEHDDGACRSWIDQILCSKYFFLSDLFNWF